LSPHKKKRGPRKGEPRKKNACWGILPGLFKEGKGGCGKFRWSGQPDLIGKGHKSPLEYSGKEKTNASRRERGVIRRAHRLSGNIQRTNGRGGKQ